MQFSQRMGITPVNTALQTQGMSEALRDSLWNVLDIFIIFILNECFTGQENFVIRATGNRNVQVQDQPWIPERARAAKQQGHPLPEGYIYVNLGRLIDALPMRPYKRLPLDKHNRVVDPRGPVHRWADLCVGACAAMASGGRAVRAAMED